MDKNENKTGKLLYVVCQITHYGKNILAVTENRGFATNLARGLGGMVEAYEDYADRYTDCRIGGTKPKMDSLQLDPFEPVGGDTNGSADRNV